MLPKILLALAGCLAAPQHVFAQALPSLINVRANTRIINHDPLRTYAYQICVGAAPDSLLPVGPPLLVGSGAGINRADGWVQFSPALYGIAGEFFVRIWFWEQNQIPNLNEALALGAAIAATDKHRIEINSTDSEYRLPPSEISLNPHPDWANAPERQDLELAPQLVSTPIAFTPDRRLMAVSEAGHVLLLDLKSGNQLNSYEAENFSPDFIALSHSSDFVLAVAHTASRAIVWDALSKKAIVEFNEEPLPAGFSLDDRHLVRTVDGIEIPLYALPDRSTPITIHPSELGVRLQWPYGILEYTEDLAEDRWHEISKDNASGDFSLEAFQMDTIFFRHRTGLTLAAEPPFESLEAWWQAAAVALHTLSVPPPPVELDRVQTLSSTTLDSASFLQLIPRFKLTGIREAVQDAEARYESAQAFLENNLAFDYKMANRYWLDKNKDGIIDLENTREYAFNVPPGSSLPLIPSYNVTLLASLHAGSSLHPYYARVPASKWPKEYITKWTVVREGIALEGFPSTYTTESRGSTAMLRLPEGTYDVTLTAEWGNAILIPSLRPTHTISGQITIKDYLIVAIGDSFTSGEGNPERYVHDTAVTVDADLGGIVTGLAAKRHRIWWADDGNTPPSIPHLAYLAPSFLFMSQNDKLVWSTYEQYPNGQYNRIPQVYSSAGAVRRSHTQAHRSSASWASKVAKAIEHRDRRSSVTFVNVASSGATIANAILTGARQEGRYRENGSDVYLPSQLATLFAMVNGRTPDLLLMSVGGNDIGFSQIIKILAANGCAIGPIFGESGTREILLKAFRDGNFPFWVQEADCSFLKGGLDAKLFNAVSGFDQLPFHLSLLRDQLTNLFPELEAKSIVQIGYPNLFSGNSGTCGNQLSDMINCSFGTPDVRLTRTDIDWATTQFLKPLNDMLKESTLHSSWTFVDSTTSAFDGHGMCEPAHRRFIVKVAEATHAQGPPKAGLDGLASIAGCRLHITTGVLHPNRDGHSILAQRVLRHLKANGLPQP